MEKDQIVILEDRGLISISGKDAREYLQNIITNDINKVSKTSSIFAALLSPQGKYLFEFFIIKSNNGYFLDCEKRITEELINNLAKYKLRSQVEIKDLSSKFVIGIINLDRFKEIQNNEKNKADTILYKESSIFVDPKKKELGARILSNLEKLNLIIKELNLKKSDIKTYFDHAYCHGIPVKGLENLKEQLFGLEANFEELNGIDFKKGCYVGQENTARMKLKNKLRRRLLPIKVDKKVSIGSEIKFNNIKIGKVLIGDPYPFALIKLFDPDFSEFSEKELFVNDNTVKIMNSH
jgi:folate-binding protein YgfZ